MTDEERHVKCHDALRTIADKDVDSGYGGQRSDFWLMIDGVEFIVTISRSGNQLAQDTIQH